MTTKTKIGDITNRTRSGSKRAAMGSIGVVKHHCPKCGHHKAFSKMGGKECTRCKAIN